jgi:excisionase family DNA binding protein
MKVKKYYTSKEACVRLNVCNKTLCNWANEGKIGSIRTKGGWRRYDLSGIFPEEEITVKSKVNVIYCRVSSHDQKNDLENQINFLKEKYPNHEIINDIGSGINFKRKGLLKLIDLAMEDNLGELVITNKDRLCRIGYELVEHILVSKSNTNIIIENKEETTRHEEITNDLIEIITVYSSRLYGSRTYKK